MAIHFSPRHQLENYQVFIEELTHMLKKDLYAACMWKWSPSAYPKTRDTKSNLGSKCVFCNY